jgi:hypothetical protein
MTYIPLNVNVYTAAFAGAIAGSGVPDGSFIVDPVSGDYAPAANIAAVFAQAVDTAWGVTTANQYDVDAIEEVCTNILTKGGGAPMTGAVTTQANWTVVATAIVALVRAGDAKAIADGITFPAVGGGSSGNGGKIYQTLFVDHDNAPLTGADGSISKPFTTIPDAIAYAVAQPWLVVELLVAPANAGYGDPVTIPNGLSVIVRGWDDTLTNPPLLLGDWVTSITQLTTTELAFINCDLGMTSIAVANPATQDLSVLFQNTRNSATISGKLVILQYRQSSQGGNISATDSASIRWDGPSWAYFLQLNPTLPLNTTHYFFDAGHDVYPQALTTTGLAIGATGFVTLGTPVCTGQRARVQVQVGDPSIQDFICGVHGVSNTGEVTVWITNISRVSTNFSETIHLLVHQEVMVAEPAP